MVVSTGGIMTRQTCTLAFVTIKQPRQFRLEYLIEVAISFLISAIFLSSLVFL